MIFFHAHINVFVVSPLHHYSPPNIATWRAVALTVLCVQCEPRSHDQFNCSDPVSKGAPTPHAQTHTHSRENVRSHCTINNTQKTTWWFLEMRTR